MLNKISHSTLVSAAQGQTTGREPLSTSISGQIRTQMFSVSNTPSCMTDSWQDDFVGARPEEKTASYQEYLRYGYNPVDTKVLWDKLIATPEDDTITARLDEKLKDQLSLLVNEVDRLLKFKQENELTAEQLSKTDLKEKIAREMLSIYACLPEILRKLNKLSDILSDPAVQAAQDEELVKSAMLRLPDGGGNKDWSRALDSLPSSGREKRRIFFETSCAKLQAVICEELRSEILRMKVISDKTQVMIDGLPGKEDAAFVGNVGKLVTKLDELRLEFKDAILEKKVKIQKENRNIGETLSVFGKNALNSMRTIPQQVSNALNKKGDGVLEFLRHRGLNAFMALSREGKERFLALKERAAPVQANVEQVQQAVIRLKKATEAARRANMTDLPKIKTPEEALLMELMMLTEDTPQTRLVSALVFARTVALQVLSAPDGVPVAISDGKADFSYFLQEVSGDLTSAVMSLLNGVQMAEINFRQQSVATELDKAEKLVGELREKLNVGLAAVSGVPSEEGHEWLAGLHTSVLQNWEGITSLVKKAGRRYPIRSQLNAKENVLCTEVHLAVLPLLNETEKLLMLCRELETALSNRGKGAEYSSVKKAGEKCRTIITPDDICRYQEALKAVFKEQDIRIYQRGDEHGLAPKTKLSSLLILHTKDLLQAAKTLRDVSDFTASRPGGKQKIALERLAMLKGKLRDIKAGIKDAVEAGTRTRLHNNSPEGLIAKDAGEWLAAQKAVWREKQPAISETEMDRHVDAVIARLFSTMDGLGTKLFRQRVKLALRDAEQDAIPWPLTADEYLTRTKTGKAYTLAWAEKRLTYGILYNLLVLNNPLAMFSPYKNTLVSPLRLLNLTLTPVRLKMTERAMKKVRPGKPLPAAQIAEYREREIYQAVFRLMSMLTPQLLKTVAATGIASYGLIKGGEYREEFFGRMVSRLQGDLFWCGLFAGWRQGIRIYNGPEQDAVAQEPGAAHLPEVLAMLDNLASQDVGDVSAPISLAEKNLGQGTDEDTARGERYGKGTGTVHFRFGREENDTVGTVLDGLPSGEETVEDGRHSLAPVTEINGQRIPLTFSNHGVTKRHISSDEVLVQVKQRVSPSNSKPLSTDIESTHLQTDPSLLFVNDSPSRHTRISSKVIDRQFCAIEKFFRRGKTSRVDSLELAVKYISTGHDNLITIAKILLGPLYEYGAGEGEKITIEHARKIIGDWMNNTLLGCSFETWLQSEIYSLKLGGKKKVSYGYLRGKRNVQGYNYRGGINITNVNINTISTSVSTSGFVSKTNASNNTLEVTGTPDIGSATNTDLLDEEHGTDTASALKTFLENRASAPEEFRKADVAVMHGDLYKRMKRLLEEAKLDPSVSDYYRRHVLGRIMPTFEIWHNWSVRDQVTLRQMDITRPEWGYLHAGALLLHESGASLEGLTLEDIKRTGMTLHVALQQKTVPAVCVVYFRQPALIYEAYTGTDSGKDPEPESLAIYDNYFSSIEHWIVENDPFLELNHQREGWKTRPELAKEILKAHQLDEGYYLNEYLSNRSFVSEKISQGHFFLNYGETAKFISLPNVNDEFDKQNNQYLDAYIEVDEIILPLLFNRLSEKEQEFMAKAQVKRVRASFSALRSVYLPAMAIRPPSLLYTVPDSVELLQFNYNGQEHIYSLSISQKTKQYELNRIDRDRRDIAWLLDDAYSIDSDYELIIAPYETIKESHESVDVITKKLAKSHGERLAKALYSEGYQPVFNEKVGDFLLSLVPFYTCISESIKGNVEEATVSCLLDTASFLPVAGQAIRVGGRFSIAAGRSTLTALRLGAQQATLRGFIRVAGKGFVQQIPIIAKEVSPQVIKSLGTEFVHSLDPGFELLTTMGKKGVSKMAWLIKNQNKTPALERLGTALENKFNTVPVPDRLPAITRSYCPMYYRELEVTVTGKAGNQNLFSQINRDTGIPFGPRFMRNQLGWLLPANIKLSKTLDALNGNVVSEQMAAELTSDMNVNRVKADELREASRVSDYKGVIQDSTGSEYIQYEGDFIKIERCLGGPFNRYRINRRDSGPLFLRFKRNQFYPETVEDRLPGVKNAQKPIGSNNLAKEINPDMFSDIKAEDLHPYSEHRTDGIMLDASGNEYIRYDNRYVKIIPCIESAPNRYKIARMGGRWLFLRYHRGQFHVENLRGRLGNMISMGLSGRGAPAAATSLTREEGMVGYNIQEGSDRELLFPESGLDIQQPENYSAYNTLFNGAYEKLSESQKKAIQTWVKVPEIKDGGIDKSTLTSINLNEKLRAEIIPRKEEMELYTGLINVMDKNVIPGRTGTYVRYEVFHQGQENPWLLDRLKVGDVISNKGFLSFSGNDTCLKKMIKNKVTFSPDSHIDCMVIFRVKNSGSGLPLPERMVNNVNADEQLYRPHTPFKVTGISVAKSLQTDGIHRVAVELEEAKGAFERNVKDWHSVEESDVSFKEPVIAKVREEIDILDILGSRAGGSKAVSEISVPSTSNVITWDDLFVAENPCLGHQQREFPIPCSYTEFVEMENKEIIEINTTGDAAGQSLLYPDVSHISLLRNDIDATEYERSIARLSPDERQAIRRWTHVEDVVVGRYSDNTKTPDYEVNYELNDKLVRGEELPPREEKVYNDLLSALSPGKIPVHRGDYLRYAWYPKNQNISSPWLQGDIQVHDIVTNGRPFMSVSGDEQLIKEEITIDRASDTNSVVVYKIENGEPTPLLANAASLIQREDEYLYKPYVFFRVKGIVTSRVIALPEGGGYTKDIPRAGVVLEQISETNIPENAIVKNLFTGDVEFVQGPAHISPKS